jgi:hypothetical protein
MNKTNLLWSLLIGALMAFAYSHFLSEAQDLQSNASTSGTVDSRNGVPK